MNIKETRKDTEKMKRCVKSVKQQSSVDNPRAVCSASTNLKKKKGDKGFTKNNIIQEQRKIGYVVATIDQSKQGYMPDSEDNIRLLKMFPFSKYPEHKSLESAISFAQKNKANVYELSPSGTYGEVVWPDKNLNEQDQNMINILKGGDYSTISGLAYHLKECGCNATMGYKNGNHTLMVRRDFLPLAIDTLKNTCDSLGQKLGDELEKRHFNMKKSDLKEMIREELEWYRGQLKEQDGAMPVVNPKKAAGIILGAVKTLFNSGAITGVDAVHADDISNELVKQINIAIAPYGQKEQPQSDELSDEEAYSEEEASLDDQSQYDPDIQKQTADPNEKEKRPEVEEPLFEVKNIAKKLKL